MYKITILGAGTWGLALASLLNDNGHKITVWSALSNEIETLKKEYKHKNLPELIISKNITFTQNLENAVKNSKIIIFAVPSIYIRKTAKDVKNFYKPDQIIINVAKGIEEKTNMTLIEQIEEEIPNSTVVVLSGPSHAEEVAKKLPTTCVIGAKNHEIAKLIQTIFMNPVFRVYTSPDIIGIELGGALKNVIALAAGIADGLGYGDNAKAALITRGMAEISRLGIKMGGYSQSFYGLSGIGDLIVTCSSMHSRNRKAGFLIGQGLSIKEAMDEVKMIVEGVYSAKAGKELAEKYKVEMPIINEVCAVLFEGKNPKLAVDSLMLRKKIVENKAFSW
ncbi:NAD(P)H-dependent glycerol-3-phosphate dehydrogenase [Fusobacterium russii]|uniref:NAD(P)H-dependent glycerol-3-phosphate dehydrogenase n=1 Tax=Fusobacterium russii TaxID=854 RepID=UPI0003A238E6|nr:NAD(P)H-dependent glycerol-3-phosphate dehydrogenase [Fusobacterium russii]